MNQRQIVQYLHERKRTLEAEERDLLDALAQRIDVNRTRRFLQDTVFEIAEVTALIVKLERRFNK
jgi:hypothetical protein